MSQPRKNLVLRKVCRLNIQSKEKAVEFNSRVVGIKEEGTSQLFGGKWLFDLEHCGDR